MPAATRGVLFMNLKSGGGKAERFQLVDECTRRGIQPVVLEPGQDWLQVVRDVAASGVDVLGMAGGDGSQAMVGTVAVELGLPMVVVPAGTRNHLALDLGLDRDDVVGALDGYGEAVERTMDLADVNGHVFVNNVSLGLYAAIVRSGGVPRREGGHDARHRAPGVGTAERTVRPAVHGRRRRGATRRPHHPDLEQPVRHDVRWPGEPASDGHPSTRCRGIGAGQAGRRRSVPRRPRIRPSGALRGLSSWAPPTFEVTSDAPIEMGLDGETKVMDSPLRFSIRPSPVRVRLPKRAIGYSPAARSLGWRKSLRHLWATALGTIPT